MSFKKGHPFRAEPPRIAHYRENPSPPGFVSLLSGVKQDQSKRKLPSTQMKTALSQTLVSQISYQVSFVYCSTRVSNNYSSEWLQVPQTYCNSEWRERRCCLATSTAVHPANRQRKWFYLWRHRYSSRSLTVLSYLSVVNKAAVNITKFLSDLLSRYQLKWYFERYFNR